MCDYAQKKSCTLFETALFKILLFTHLGITFCKISTLADTVLYKIYFGAF